MKPISASQLKTARMCLRRWGYESLEGRKPPPTPAMLRGTRLHKTVENYLLGKDVTGDPDWPLVRLATPHLPYSPLVRVEQRFDVNLFGIDYTGIVDFEDPDFFGDHKTCTSFDHAIRSDALALDDPQYLLYSTVLETSRARWIYYRVKGSPKVEAYDLNPRGDAVVCAFETIVHPLAEKLVGIRKKNLQVSSLPRNIDSCGMYPPHGCPHKAYCKPTESEHMSDKDDIMSLFDSASREMAVKPAASSMPPPKPDDRINAPEARSLGQLVDHNYVSTFVDEAIEQDRQTREIAEKVPLLTNEPGKSLQIALDSKDDGLYDMISILCDRGYRQSLLDFVTPLAIRALGGKP